MTLSGRPLLRAADLQLFVGRHAERERAARGLRSHLNCVVIGEPGSGKTTFCRAVLAGFHQADVVDVTVRAAAADTPAQILGAISAELAALGFADRSASPPSRGEALDLVDRIRRQVDEADIPSTATVVFLVEDIAADPGWTLFGGLRDELWTVDARWLVTVSAAQSAGLLRPPADVFFEVRISLPALDDPTAAHLIRKRVPDVDPVLLKQVVSAAAGNPRRLIDLTRELSGNPSGAPLITEGLRRRDAAVAALGRPARMLAGELEALGDASASDQRLLNRMGWTRARAVQVLRELEDSGLVTHRTENTGRGRPRKVYRLRPVEEFSDGPRVGGQMDPDSSP